MLLYFTNLENIKIHTVTLIYFEEYNNNKKMEVFKL